MAVSYDKDATFALNASPSYSLAQWTLEIPGMTEQEWLACTDASKLVDQLHGSRKIPRMQRKMRLFACAVCWHDRLCGFPQFPSAVFHAEYYADWVPGADWTRDKEQWQ